MLVIDLLMIEASPTKEPTPNIQKLENKMFSTESMAQQNLWSAVVEEGKQRELTRKWQEIWKAENGNNNWKMKIQKLAIINVQGGKWRRVYVLLADRMFSAEQGKWKFLNRLNFLCTLYTTQPPDTVLLTYKPFSCVSRILSSPNFFNPYPANVENKVSS